MSWPMSYREEVKGLKVGPLVPEGTHLATAANASLMLQYENATYASQKWSHLSNFTGFSLTFWKDSVPYGCDTEPWNSDPWKGP